jgi:predicted small integral membrane protein
MTDLPRTEPARTGFLPIKTNAFDRGFIGVVCFIAIHLFWMRFIEATIPLWVATILAVALGVFIVKRG